MPPVAELLTVGTVHGASQVKVAGVNLGKIGQMSGPLHFVNLRHNVQLDIWVSSRLCVASQHLV